MKVHLVKPLVVSIPTCGVAQVGGYKTRRETSIDFNIPNDKPLEYHGDDKEGDAIVYYANMYIHIPKDFLVFVNA